MLLIEILNIHIIKRNMIYNVDDLLPELEKLHPNVTKKSLKKIVTKGLQRLHKYLVEDFEVEMYGDSLYHDKKDWFKFIKLMTPEEQFLHSSRKYKAKKKQRESLIYNKHANKTSNK